MIQASVKMSCFISYYTDTGSHAALGDVAYRRHYHSKFLLYAWDYFKHFIPKLLTLTIETLSYYGLLSAKSTGFDQFFLES